MAERLTLVCDRRGRGGHLCPNEASTYYVTMADSSKWRTDLCDIHAADLEQVRDYGERDRQARKSARKTFKRTAIAPKP